jgi:hypothetical protein
MNERLKQLAEQAGFQYIKDEGIGWAGNYNASLPKFAELIVEKCAGIIESQDVDPSFKLRMSWAVKQYFGVEEC